MPPPPPPPPDSGTWRRDHEAAALERLRRRAAVLALVITAAAALLLVDPAPDAAAQNALPELKITEGPAVPEGQGLTFTISATHPTLDRDLTVNLQVTEDTSQSRTYLRDSERGSKRAVIYAGMDTGTYTVKTVNDNNDEYDGAVTVTLRPRERLHRGRYQCRHRHGDRH